MRINVYSQELTSDTETVIQQSNTGKYYWGIRLFFHSSPLLHHTPDDDDRTAVTFWLPKSNERRRELAATFRKMADLVDAAPIETMKFKPDEVKEI